MRSTCYSKTLASVLFFLLLICNMAKAQYVTIPDANFVTYLQTWFPSAMSGNQMDTTDNSIVTAAGIDVSNLNIYNLSGVQYFDAMYSLKVSHNPFVSWPTLPSNLLVLYVDNCGLSSLGALPAGLLALHCDTNNLSSLPPLPPLLNYLTCRDNLISCLPELPDSVATLFASSNPGLICLPNIPTAPSFSSDIGTTLCAQPSNIATTSTTCNGGNDGTIVLTMQGCNSPYTFLWSNSTVTQNQTGLSAGTYTCTVTDVNSTTYTFSTTITEPAAITVSFSTTNATCFGLNNGVICANVSGGAGGPYTYLWNQGSTATCLYNLTAGSYSIVVTDMNGCTGTGIATVSEPSLLGILAGPDANICAGDTIQVCPLAFGGTPPYTYEINGAPVPGCTTVSVTGVYTVFVTDANGCTAVDNLMVTVYPVPVSNLPSTIPYCDNLNPTCVMVTGQAPFVYQWSDSGTGSCHYFLNSGVYSITVVDANGCSSTQSTTVGNGVPVSVSLSSLTYSTCGMCDGAVSLSYSGGLAPYNLNYTPFPPPNLNALCANDFFEVDVTDQNACVASLSFNMPSGCDEVWPGDANHDGTANNVDLLAIGIGYGATGPARPGATINWQAETCTDWADTLLSGVNFKHIDCNGDGIIADDDTIAILQNYGLSHPLRIAAHQSSVTDPPLYFDLIIDTIGTSQQFSIPLELGTAALPMDSIYGIAFTINYDTSLVKADSVFMSFPYCWLGSYGTEAISIAKNDPLNGKLYAAITRINHADTSGFGEVARLTVVTTDNVSGRLTSPSYDTLSFTISDVKAINFTQNDRPLVVLNDSLIIEDLTGITDVQLLAKMIFYPNPVSDVLKVIMPDQVEVLNIEVTDMLGRLVKYEYVEKGNNLNIRLNGNSSGLLDVKVVTSKGVVTKKISVIGN